MTERNRTYNDAGSIRTYNDAGSIRTYNDGTTTTGGTGRTSISVTAPTATIDITQE